MSFQITVPLSSAEVIDLTINTGESLFILGANGTGKSSLMQRIYSSHFRNARRISAHRQTWFTSNAIDLSPRQKQQFESSIQSKDIGLESRWKDDYATQRASIAVYDLIDSENVRSRKIAYAVDEGNLGLAETLSKDKASPVAVINRLLRLSDIPIRIVIKEGAEVFASKNGSPLYSIAELSDGERNALLLAAEVLTVEKGQLIVIDEPERHLHRSIISPLLTLLFSERQDCAFVVSTHDVMLPLDNSGARTLLVRSCTYAGSNVTAWEADIVDPDSAIEEDIRKDILGARRKILFVEGTENSLDKPLYSLIFPNVSIVSKSNCREVEHAVNSIRDANEVHWLNAFGIVDSDQRPEDEIDRLKEKGVYALPVFSVESIYYHPKIQEFVARAHAKVTGEDEQALINKAQSETIKALEPHVQRLSERAAMQSIRKKFFSHIPQKSDISTREKIEISIDIESTVLSRSGQSFIG